MSAASSFAKMMKARAMALKAVVLGLPSNAKERELLEKDLHRIGCQGFLERSWGLRVEKLVAELMEEKDNRWHGTVRQAPDQWMWEYKNKD